MCTLCDKVEGGADMRCAAGGAWDMLVLHRELHQPATHTHNQIADTADAIGKLTDSSSAARALFLGHGGLRVCFHEGQECRASCACHLTCRMLPGGLLCCFSFWSCV
jgi:hypothetical protein